MYNLKYCTFLLILLSSYALCDCLKLVVNKGNSPRERDYEQFTAQQNILQATSSTSSSSSSSLSGEKTTGMTAGLRNMPRQKRSQSELSSSEYKDLSDILDDLEDNTLATTLASNAAFENMTPLIYHLILQKLKQLQANDQAYRVLTPRLGRSIDFRHLASTFDSGLGSNIGADSSDIVSMRQPKHFVSHLIKKSVPFKPRLGKRTQQPILCD